MPAAGPHEDDPSAGTVPDNGAPAGTTRESEPPGGEPAPAFWRAQAQPPVPGYGRVPAGEPDPALAEPDQEPAETAGGRATEGVGDPEVGLALGEPAVIQVPLALGEPAVTPAPPAPGEPAVIQAPPAPAPAAPAAAVPAPAGAPSPAAVASPGSPGSPSSISPQRWSKILVAFVDDPRRSVEMAAGAVGCAIEELVASVRARQQDLASSWQASDADTEQLRVVLREYRRFGAQIQQMSPDGRETAAAR